MKFLLNKNGNYIITAVLVKIAIVFILGLVEYSTALYVSDQLKQGTIHACESALKNIYVNNANMVCIDQTKMSADLQKYMQLNLDLGSDFSPSINNTYLASRIVITELSIYDPTTSGLPVSHSGKTFQYPTIHISYTANIKAFFAQTLKLPLYYPIKVHVDESNEPLN